MGSKRNVAIRHAEYYVEYLRNLNNQYENGGENTYIARSEATLMQAQLEAALRWAITNVDKEDKAANLLINISRYGEAILDFIQLPNERIAWLDQAVMASETLISSARRQQAMNHIFLGEAYSQTSDFEKSLHYYNKALEVSEITQDEIIKSRSLNGLGRISLEQGKFEEAIKLFSEALEIARMASDKRRECDYLGFLGRAYYNKSEYPDSIELYKRGLQISREVGYIRGQVTHLNNLATAYKDMDLLKQAMIYANEALELCHKLSDQRSSQETLQILGEVYLEGNEGERSLELLTQAQKLAQVLGDTLNEASIVYNLARTHFKLKNYPVAKEHYELALEIYLSIGINVKTDEIKRALKLIEAIGKL